MIDLFSVLASSPIESLGEGVMTMYDRFFEYGKIVLFTMASGGLLATVIKSIR